MFPGATLFGVALVLIIVASLAFLLIRKPSLSFGGISVETTRLETKSKKSKDETKKVSQKCPSYLGYLKEIPKNARMPNECLTCTKMVECQGLDAFRWEEALEETTQPTQPLIDSEKPSEQVELQGVIEKRKESEAFRREEVLEETKETTQTLRGPEKPLEQVKPQEIVEGREVSFVREKQDQQRPSGCLHFFGYLRNMPKNTLIPDECLGCSKMVECLYHTILE